MAVRAIFMGTPDFAVPTLEALVAQGWDILVVTQPDKKVGRKRVLTPTPVKKAALAHGLPVLQPIKVRAREALAQLAAFAPDLLVTAAYGQLLPQALLDMPRVGAVNVHASLLPRWRGAAPIHRAIMAGDKKTGVTLMEMVRELDAGPIIAQAEVPITEQDNVDSLHDKLAHLGAEMSIQYLPQYLEGQLQIREQPTDGVTYAARLERTDEFVDFNQPSQVVYDHIRGLASWPGATTFVGGEAIKLWAVEPIGTAVRLKPGEVARVHKDVLVGCADGCLRLLELQPAGRRKMSAGDWLSGLHQASVQFEKGPGV